MTETAPRTTRARLSPEEKKAREEARKAEKAAQKAAKAAQKAQEKEAERQAKIAEAAGPILELPAVQFRGMEPTSVDLKMAFDFLMTDVNKGNSITVDVETSGYPVGHQHYSLRTVQLGREGYAFVFDAEDPMQMTLAAQVLQSAQELHAHNATADLVPLAVAGVVNYREAWSRMTDTAVLTKLASNELTGGDPGLKQLAPNVLTKEGTVIEAADKARKALFTAGKWLMNTEQDTPPERSGWYQVDKRCTTMIAYAASDVLDTAAIAERLPRPPAHVLDRERRFQAVMARVAYEGVRLDLDRVRKQIGEYEPQREAAAETLKSFGVENPGSPKQLSEALVSLGAELNVTDSGAPSTDKDSIKAALSKAEQGTDLDTALTAVLEWRKADKLLIMLKAYEDLCVNGDGFARPTIYTLGTDTGRTSCVRPNLQQVPKSGSGKPGIRQCFRSVDDDHVLIACDFSQVEVRVGAALSQDQNFMKMITEGLNLHNEIADMVYGPGNWDSKQKTQIKAMNFCKMFGGGARTMAKQAGCSVSLAEQVSKKFDAYAPAFAAWAKKLVKGVEMGKTEYETYSGRMIHLDPRAAHKAMNYPIQGTARELAVDASLAFADGPYGYGWQMIIHDELMVQVRKEDAEAARQYLLDVMTSEFKGVPITAEADDPDIYWPMEAS